VKASRENCHSFRIRIEGTSNVLGQRRERQAGTAFSTPVEQENSMLIRDLLLGVLALALLAAGASAQSPSPSRTNTAKAPTNADPMTLVRDGVKALADAQLAQVNGYVPCMQNPEARSVGRRAGLTDYPSCRGHIPTFTTPSPTNTKRLPGGR
jgi:hypothetical protein